MRSMMRDIRRLQALPEDELYNEAKELEVPYDLVKYVHENGKLPVVNFAAGGVATPAGRSVHRPRRGNGGHQRGGDHHPHG